jgi:hypothetical protein
VSTGLSGILHPLPQVDVTPQVDAVEEEKYESAGNERELDRGRPALIAPDRISAADPGETRKT